MDNSYEELSVIESKEKRIAKVKRMNLFNDVLCSVVFRNKDACEHLVRVLMGDDSLRIVELRTQNEIPQLISHSVKLDVLAEDDKGHQYEIEVQRQAEKDPVRRVRYYAATADSEALHKGVEYHKLPELYIFYISKKDIWQLGMPVYEIKKYVGSTWRRYDDGLHVTYVNAAVDDGSRIADLMRYFKKANVKDKSQGRLSEYVSMLKGEKGGLEYMDRWMKKFYDGGMKIGLERGKAEGKAEGAVENKYETAISMFEHGETPEKVELYTKLSRQDVLRLQEQVMAGVLA